jgi:hypothetical protein
MDVLTVIQRRVHRCWPNMLLAAVILSSVGCSRGGRPEPPRYPISGTVTLDGKPLQEGKVQFVTVSQGLIEAFPIRKGRFSGKAAAGERRVEFYIIKEVPYAESGLMPMPGEVTPAIVKLQMLPPHLNTESTFSATVDPAEKNEFSFDLVTKSPTGDGAK